ncbi:hypothetical protein BH11ACT8_BH11ACT8_18410 [soil metagenome]
MSPQSHLSSRSRRISLIAAPALALSAFAVLPLAPATAAVAEPVPLQHGVSWLKSQLTNGLVHNNQYDFDDLGLSVDTGLTMAYLGEGDTAGDISDALAPVVTSYYTYDVSSYDDQGVPTFVGTHVSAGSLAKAAAFVEAAGDVPTEFGGQDLIGQLLERVSTDDASLGRIGDVFFPDESFEDDFSNTIGQAFAANAFDGVENAAVVDTSAFLLAQQCEEGFFRLDLGATLAEDCDADPAATPDTDATALALIELSSMDFSSTGTLDAISAATDWLLANQNADGSFGGAGPTSAANANSTGLAGWALGDLGETDAAAKAAVWLRAHQADDFGPCTTGLTGATGAIAYDDGALAAGRSDGLVVQVEDQFRRGTAQALPALLWAPAGTYASEPTSTQGFVRAGSTQEVEADHLAPGQTVCFARGASQDLVNADADGHAVGHVKLRSGSGTRTYGVGLTDGRLGTISFHALGAKSLPLTIKDRVRQGTNQRVIVRGLATGERVRVFYNGRKHVGTANAKHRYVSRFKVARKVGRATVRVVGEFGNRTSTSTFRVIKGR